MAYIISSNVLLGYDLLDNNDAHQQYVGPAPLKEAHTIRVVRQASGGYTAHYNALVFDQSAVSLLCEIEPGRHEIRKFERTLDAENAPIAVDYFFVAPETLPSDPPILDIEHSDLVQKTSIVYPDLKFLTFRDHYKRSLALRRFVFQGRHLWRGAGEHFPELYSCSDEFKRAWELRKLSGFEFEQCIEI